MNIPGTGKFFFLFRGMSTNERHFRQPASKDAEREQLRGAWQRLSEENFPMDVESVYPPEIEPMDTKNDGFLECISISL